MNLLNSLKLPGMNTKAVLLSSVLILTSMGLYSQTDKKSDNSPFKRNLIGIQFDPYSDYNELFNAFVYGIRFGHKISAPITIGGEFSGSFPNNLRPFGQRDVNSLTIGLYARYSFLTDKRVQPFVEASPFFRYRHVLAMDFLPPIDKSNIGVYIAPGFSLFTKSRRFSLDLYYKIYFPPSGIYNERSTPSFKINYHF
jgi:hypothetical protein